MKLINTQMSQLDSTIKYVFEDSNKKFDATLEVSSIRKGDSKDILVLPTQTSCSMGCKFCHLTGLDIPAKNLSALQMLSLVVDAVNLRPPANDTLLVSFMGAGEPLLNVDEVILAADNIWSWMADFRLYDTVRFAAATILPSRPRFDRLLRKVDEQSLDFKLHVSLHSLVPTARKSLMPSAAGIEETFDMLEIWAGSGTRKAEIHYTPIKGVNDRLQDVEALARWVPRYIPIKLLKFSEHKLEPSLHKSDSLEDFKSRLEQHGFVVEVYDPPGRDIGSSCGQFTMTNYRARS